MIDFDGDDIDDLLGAGEDFDLTPAEMGPGELPRHDGMEVLTYSSLNTLRNCPRKFDLRYQRWLSGPRRSAALFTGSVFHGALDTFYRALLDGDDVGVARDTCMGQIDAQCADALGEEWGRVVWHHARTMFDAYINRWSSGETAADVEHRGVRDDELDLIKVEEEFIGPIVNPATGAQSRTFQFAGAVDRVVRLKEDGRLYIVETKTTGRLDGAYLEKLWTDFQSMLYAHYLGKYVYDEPFAGVIYDIAEKVRRAPTFRSGETDEQFAERLAGYKTEKTREKHLAIGPKQEYREPWDEYEARLAEEYKNPARQHREIILFDADRLAQIEDEVWDMTKQIMAARSRDLFTMNTSQCYAWGRPCDFVAICRAGRNDETTRCGLEQRTPHSELNFMGLNSVAADDDDDLIF